MTDSRPVLVVIDVQNGFVDDRTRHVVPTLVDLIRRWAGADGDVVFTRYHNYPGSPYERLIGWTKLAGPPATDLIDELAPYVGPDTPILDKSVYTLFTDAGEQLVRERGWTDLYVCGIDTDSCVLKTAVDAFERDLTPWIVTDASASHGGPAAHDAGLAVARRFIGARQLITSAGLPDSVLPLPA